jgi:hypothetical protein
MSTSDRYETEKGQARKLTPKMLAFKAYYLDPQSPTYNNALQSALKAGYTQSYAETITAQAADWIYSGDNLRKEMLEKAERNLNKIIDMSDDKLENPTMAKMWQDTNKFISERLGKEFYSSRQELTDKGGRRLFTEKSKDTASIPLSKLFKVQSDA